MFLPFSCIYLSKHFPLSLSLSLSTLANDARKVKTMPTFFQKNTFFSFSGLSSLTQASSSWSRSPNAFRSPPPLPGGPKWLGSKLSDQCQSQSEHFCAHQLISIDYWTQLHSEQCDQIVWFFAFWASIQSRWQLATIILPKSLTLLGDFCKSFLFLVKYF